MQLVDILGWVLGGEVCVSGVIVKRAVVSAEF